MQTDLKLQTAIHLALGLSAGALAASYAPNAIAQLTDVEEHDERTIEEVVITGSRIKRADLESASPVTILTRDDIEAAGLTDIGSLLQRMPSMSGSPRGTTTNNDGDGAVLIDLRGMGTDRTLTLINGKRVVDGGDYQTIPSTMIERVEILKDGASAVYGADAVAGVVNIITRRDFEGIEFTAQAADWIKSDAGLQYSFGLIAGAEFDAGNVVFGLEYVDQEEAFQSDTPWAFMQDSPYIYPAGCENQMFAPYDFDDPNSGCYMGGSSRIPESNLGFMNQGTFLIGTMASEPYQAGLMEDHDGRNYNYAPINYLQTPFKRTNVFSEAHFFLTENVRFNAEFRANFRESAQELAPMPYDSRPFLDPAHGGVYNGIPYNGIHQDNYYLRQAVDTYNAANPDSTLVYEPISDIRRRMIESARRFEQDVVQYQYVAGLEGAFSEMDWDIFLNQGYRTQSTVDTGQLSGTALFNALGPSADLDGDGMPECYTDINDPTSILNECVPLNMFGGGSVIRETGEVTGQSVTEDMLNYVSVPLNDTEKWDSTQVGASITGSIWELPGGGLGWAAGYGYWKQEYTYSPDSLKIAKNVTGNKGDGTHGDLVNNSVFLEVLAPVWDNGTQKMYLKGGLRYDDFNHFDGDTTWQFGIEFQVVDSLKLRGTAGSVFRAPTIDDLFGGAADDFPTYNDPCVPNAGETLPPGCDRVGVQDDSQVLTVTGGNPDVFPETGDTFTAGLVWTPQFGNHGFTTTVDYWEIDLEDGISSFGADPILTDCYVNEIAEACALVTRRPDNYQVIRIIDQTLNVASSGAKGIDTEIHWDYSSNFGQWQAAFLWAHLLDRTKVAFPGSDTEQLEGTYTNPTVEDGGAYAEDKVGLSLQWYMNDLSLGYMAEYISSMTSTAVFLPDYVYSVPSRMYHDLVASYTWGGITVTGGLTNITNEEPPYIDDGFNAKTDPPTYRVFGRGWYLRMAWKF